MADYSVDQLNAMYKVRGRIEELERERDRLVKTEKARRVEEIICVVLAVVFLVVAYVSPVVSHALRESSYPVCTQNSKPDEKVTLQVYFGLLYATHYEVSTEIETKREGQSGTDKLPASETRELYYYWIVMTADRELYYLRVDEELNQLLEKQDFSKGYKVYGKVVSPPKREEFDSGNDNEEEKEEIDQIITELEQHPIVVLDEETESGVKILAWVTAVVLAISIYFIGEKRRRTRRERMRYDQKLEELHNLLQTLVMWSNTGSSV